MTDHNPLIDDFARHLSDEVRDRAMRDVEARLAAERLTLTDDELNAVEIGIAAGYVATVLELAERGFLHMDLRLDEGQS